MVESSGLSFSFAVAGWLMMYYYGVAKAIQEFGLDRGSKFAGSSAGALASVALVLGCDMDKLRLVSLEMCKNARSKFMNRFKLRDFLIKVLSDIFPPEQFDEYQEKLNSQLGISVTYVMGLQNKRYTVFESYDHFIAVLCASCCCVPIGGFPFTLDNRLVFDGGFSDLQPLVDEYSITISPMNWSKADIHPSGYVPVWWMPYPPPPDEFSRQFDLGYFDSKKYFIEKYFKRKRLLTLPLSPHKCDLLSPLPLSRASHTVECSSSSSSRSESTSDNSDVDEIENNDNKTNHFLFGQHQSDRHPHISGKSPFDSNLDQGPLNKKNENRKLNRRGIATSTTVSTRLASPVLTATSGAISPASLPLPRLHVSSMGQNEKFTENEDQNITLESLKRHMYLHAPPRLHLPDLPGLRVSDLICNFAAPYLLRPALLLIIFIELIGRLIWLFFVKYFTIANKSHAQHYSSNAGTKQHALMQKEKLISSDPAFDHVSFHPCICSSPSKGLRTLQSPITQTCASICSQLHHRRISLERVLLIDESESFNDVVTDLFESLAYLWRSTILMEESCELNEEGGDERVAELRAVLLRASKVYRGVVFFF